MQARVERNKMGLKGIEGLVRASRGQGRAQDAVAAETKMSL